MTNVQFGPAETLEVKRSIARPSVLNYLFHRIQERVRRPAARKRLSDFIAWLRRGGRIDQDSTMSSMLERDGTLMFPGFLPPERAAELYDMLQAMTCRDPWKPGRGRFALDDAPPDTHVADIIEAPLLKAAHDIAFDERLLGLAARYFGAAPYVDSIQAWWSLPTAGEPEEAENFHRDNDSIRFLKFFLYLSDVGDEQGPHKFVVGSHSEPALLARRRLTDEEVAETFGAERILTITGSAGDAFIEDTFGIHKGQQPRQGRRLLLQVRYSVTPTIFRSRLTVDAPAPVDKSLAVSLVHDGASSHSSNDIDA
jgi:hypothetical protein